MLFDMSGSGEIQRVFYPEDEDAVALTLKKILLGTLSSRLVVSASQRAAGARWAYRVNETGHEGVHTAVYHARPLDEDGGIVFTKIRQTKALENADQGQTKMVRLNTTLGIPMEIAVKESFHSPNELASSYRPTIPEAKQALEKGNTELNLPKMGGTSTAVMTFVKADLLDNVRENKEDGIWSGMRNSSLKVEPIPPSKVNLITIKSTIKGNISCIIKAHADDVHTGLPCFRDLATMLTRLSREDIDKLTKYYLQGKQPEVARQTMIDALGTAQTSDCYTVMMRQVFLIKQPEAELLMRALFQ
ncbi:hypothetical protein LSAT2_008646 [Lamellibrachia satsuma]|nr:hypothetical protein LSAT2_008646 [Lamellibrachia satsuma]